MKRCESGARPGFTIFDLLVMLVVVVMLLALLLPAIQRMRVASNAMRCGNNLSMLAIAFHNYHNDYNIFPTGGGNSEQGRAYGQGGKIERNPPVGGVLPQGAQVVAAPQQEWGWGYQILPYIEQNQLYWLPQDNTIRQTPIPNYFCPVRRLPMANANNAKGLTMAGIDYAGNGGITGPAKAIRWLTRDSYKPPYGDYTATGLVIRSSHWYPEKGPKNRVVSLDGGVPDGTSNTVMIAHKRMQTQKINKNPPNDDWSFVDGWGDDTIVRYHPEDDALQPMQDDANPVPPFAMGSAHPRSFPVALGDRSIRFIRYSAKPEALAAIMIRDDGQNINWRDLE